MTRNTFKYTRESQKSKLLGGGKNLSSITSCCDTEEHDQENLRCLFYMLSCLVGSELIQEQC